MGCGLLSYPFPSARLCLGLPICSLAKRNEIGLWALIRFLTLLFLVSSRIVLENPWSRQTGGRVCPVKRTNMQFRVSGSQDLCPLHITSHKKLFHNTSPGISYKIPTFTPISGLHFHLVSSRCGSDIINLFLFPLRSSTMLVGTMNVHSRTALLQIPIGIGIR